MIRKIILLVLGISCMIGIYWFFIRPTDKQNESTPTWDIVTTIYPLYDITKNIASDDLQIGLLLPPGASSHTFESSPMLIERIAHAKILFAIGHGIDDWTQNILPPSTQIMIVDKNINLIADEENPAMFNPHYWLSGQNGKIIAQNIANTLIATYPEKQEAIEQNLQIYLGKLQETDETVHTIINEVGNKNIVTLHDAWYYFAEAYGLTIVGTYTPSSEKEPLPQDLKYLQEIVSKYRIQTLYSEEQTFSASIQAFLEDNKLILATLDEFGGLEKTKTYLDLLLYNANVFASQP